MPLAQAIHKYGEENFTIEVICECDRKDLDKKEQFYINKYNTFFEGYNATKGGSNGAKRDIDINEMIELYHSTKSVRKVAKYYGVDKETISKRLHKLNIPLYTMSEQRGIKVIIKKDNKVVHTFNSKIECAKWFLEKNIPKSKKVDTIRKQIDSNENYYGYEIIISNKI